MGEGFDQFRQGGLAQVDRASSDPVLVIGHQAIDTAAVVAVIQVEVFLDFVGDGPRVLDYFAIHVADVEAAVGGVGEVDHANPGVAARGKLEALLIGRTFPREVDAIGGRRDHLAVDELAAGVAREAVVLEGRTIGIAAIDCRTGSPGEVTAHTTATFHHARDRTRHAPTRAHDAPRFVGADAEDFGRAAVFGDAGPRGGQGKERILGETGAIVDPVLEVVGIRAGELTPEVVEAHPVLSAAGLEAERMRLRVEPEVIAAEFEGGEFRTKQAGDLAAVASAGEEMDALVGSPLHAIGHSLDVDEFHPRAETREHLHAVVSDAFAGTVFKAPDVGRRDDVESAVGPNQSSWPG